MLKKRYSRNIEVTLKVYGLILFILSKTQVSRGSNDVVSSNRTLKLVLPLLTYKLNNKCNNVIIYFIFNSDKYIASIMKKKLF